MFLVAHLSSYSSQPRWRLGIRCLLQHRSGASGGRGGGRLDQPTGTSSKQRTVWIPEDEDLVGDEGIYKNKKWKKNGAQFLTGNIFLHCLPLFFGAWKRKYLAETNKRRILSYQSCLRMTTGAFSSCPCLIILVGKVFLPDAM